MPAQGPSAWLLVRCRGVLVHGGMFEGVLDVGLGGLSLDVMGFRGLF